MLHPMLQGILDEFYQLCAIPHPSHHEERIGDYLLSWAADHGLSGVRDKLGDIIIDKAASPGQEGAARLILQAHMDMVCVAEPGRGFDPLTDPIIPVLEGDRLRADGTSLGADDGIGVAIALYLLADDSLIHGPLRAIFTVNEEDGMASGDIDPEYLQAGALINLDWETEGSLCNSCAGGDFYTFSKTGTWAPPAAEARTLRLSISGLKGGHSGVEINKGRANAITALAEALVTLGRGGVGYALADCCGGQARNAIPASAQAWLCLDKGQCPQAQSLLKDFAAAFAAGYSGLEPELQWDLAWEEARPERVLSGADSGALAELLCALPNNVHTMSPFVEGLVESSSNLGLLSVAGDKLEFTLMTRSSAPYQAQQLERICQVLAGRFGFDFIAGEHTPAWAVNPDSALTAIACEEYKKLTGRDMVVEPVHAGLECGAFAEKNPQLDMISIGPTLLDVHSPQEVCLLDGVLTTAQLAAAVIQRYAL